MSENFVLYNDLARLGKKELRIQYKKCLAGDLTNPVSPFSLYFMRQYGFITAEEFAYINKG